MGSTVRQKTWLSPLGLYDKKFIAVGDGSKPCVFDHESLKPEKIDKDLKKNIQKDINTTN